MDHSELRRRFAALTTAHLADACLRARIPLRCASLRAVVPGSRVAGRVAPARHVGSVDIFLEVLERTGPGHVLVVGNDGRLDERPGPMSCSPSPRQSVTPNGTRPSRSGPASRSAASCGSTATWPGGSRRPR